MPFPFEVPFEEVISDIDHYVDEVCSSLQSGFMTMPKGPGFIEYPTFESGYQTLKRATNGFHSLVTDQVIATVQVTPMSLIVLRSMLGFTPSEWADAATARTNIQVTQGAARSIDRKIRISPEAPLQLDGVTGERIRALVSTACELLVQGPETVEDGLIHRLQKADTASGLSSIVPLADIGVPYPMLLYEG